MRTGLLALIGVGLLFAAWVLNFVLPGSGIAVWAIVAVGAGFIAAAALWDLRRVRGALASRRGIIGIGASVSLSLAIGTVVLANLVSSTLFHRFDFTGLQQFTLTTQTKEVLAELDSEVEVVSFFAEPNPNMENSAEIAAVNSFGFELLKEYETYSDRLRIRREDPELRPDLARQYGVNPFGAAVGTVVFRGEFGQMNVYGPQIQGEAESAFTSALLQVTGTRQRVIYFLTGHGEGSILGEYESARRGLRDNLFQIGELNLDQVDDIPPNANVVIVAGPQAPYAPDEIELLGRYLRAGGRLALLLNPNPQQEFRDFAGDWWLTIEEGILVDPPAHVAPNVDVPLVDRARNAYGLREAYFPGAAAISPATEVPEEAKLEPLAWTSRGSWVERSRLGAAAPEFDPDADARGPLALAVAVQRPAAPDAEVPVRSDTSRLVLVGDSDFATNQHFRNGNNSALFLTMVNWLGAGEEIFSVDRKVLPVRRLVLSPEEARFLNLSSVGLLPLLLVVAAAIVWWRRR